MSIKTTQPPEAREERVPKELRPYHGQGDGYNPFVVKVIGYNQLYVFDRRTRRAKVDPKWGGN